MKIIVGATGQIGSNIVQELSKKQTKIRAITHKSTFAFDKNVDTKPADLLNTDEVINAFEGGTTAFLLTPERPDSADILGETRQIIENYKTAIKKTGIKKIVGLSCNGAQIEDGTGNILMSRMLEQAFNDFNMDKIFVRPSYFYSNWLGYLDLVKNESILPTFFPADLKIDMLSPLDVAKFISKQLLNNEIRSETEIFELTGPEHYSSKDIAEMFSKKLNSFVKTQVISAEERIPTLLSVGFTDNAAQNLSAMTQAVIDQRIVLENKDKAIRMPTAFYDYIETII